MARPARDGALLRRTTYYAWEGDQVAAELDAQGNVTAAYAYYPGVDRPHSARVAPFTGSDRTYYYVQGDAPGTVLGLVDATATVAATYAVDAWGQPTKIDEPGLGGWRQPYLFAGREYDRETGLYSNRARYYDPVARRFLSEDPSGLAGGVNLYAYAGNDPVNYRDPGGACPTNVNADDDIDTCGGGGGGGSQGKVPVLTEIHVVGWPFATHREDGWTANFLNPNARGGTLGRTGGLGGYGGPWPYGPLPAPPRPTQAGPTPHGPTPSCASISYPGSSGTINVQTDPKTGTIAWDVVMHSPMFMGGTWAYQEFVGGKSVVGDVKQRNVLHGSVNPKNAISGALFQLEVNYIDPFGFTHRSVPNACIIP